MFRNLSRLTVTGLATAIVIGFFGFIHPALDTIANFRWHFSVALLVMAIMWFFCFGRRGSLLLAVIAIGGWVSCYSPLSHLYIQPSGNLGNTRYSLLQLNLYYVNQTPQKVFDLISRIKPDILTFNELSRKWKQRLTVLDSEYPFSYYCPEWTTIGGSIIYSRLPMSDKKGSCHSFASLALKDITIAGKTITIGAVHLRWPWPASGPRQVDELKPVLEQLQDNALIAGDFNSTSWTWLVRRFANYGNLNIIRYTGASWMYRTLPTSLAGLFGLSIDNAMVKGSINIHETRTLEPVGSDHLPLYIRFSVD